MDATRRGRMESVIREQLSVLISREIRDPRVVPITITSVEVTADGSQATICITPFGLKTDKLEQCLEGLKSSAGFLRKKLGRILEVKNVPHLIFKEDRGLENSLRIHEILSQLKQKPGDES